MMKTYFTPQAPKPIGPYAQAVRAGDFLYASGQIPLDPATGALEPGGIKAQAIRALTNLKAVLAVAGAEWSQVVKTTVYLTDLQTFSAVNAAYADVFSEPYPARAVVGVAALPAGAEVEIEAVAYLGR